MTKVQKAFEFMKEANRRRVLAPANDPIRRDFDLNLSKELDRDAQALLTPCQPLQMGLGGEIIPPPEDALPGLELTLKEPDLLNLGASEQRAGLLERAGVLELGIETAQDAKADGSIQKMLSHQMAVLHARAMTMLAESDLCKDPDIAIKKARASARMVDAFSRAALTLQRLQNGVGQTIQVQYMQVNAMVGDERRNMQNPEMPSRNRGGRPPTTGYRTKEAIAQRQADRALVKGVSKSDFAPQGRD